MGPGPSIEVSGCATTGPNVTIIITSTNPNELPRIARNFCRARVFQTRRVPGLAFSACWISESLQPSRKLRWM